MLLESFGFQDVRDYVVGKADWLARGLPVERAEEEPVTAGLVAEQPPIFEPEMSTSDATSMIDHQGGAAGVVVGEGGVVLGLLTREAAGKEPDATIEEVMELGPSTFRADADLDGPIGYMDRHDVDQVVVAEPDGRLIGLLTREAAQEANSES